ncbi:HTH-type transcriptional regulator BetI [Microbacterium hydrocarbonoxydans]|jgi:AcrR family transcriptional regulator|uniref:HTH-type transcriptional regulator BetI n=1 Tax=Microbacterium hydrocarbonoxydans TaxID=273678 RepID=A0A0M2HQT8_9MICO|nr:TetR/AcrR family transcriptional regulator [Microbacterium hydrocarbonoxydans]KJL49056.1 HTH-type transcriptional regulator BetI [Microbacterium hydrocarbonoxydans]
MNTTSRAAAKRLPPAERERSIVDGAMALAHESGIEALTVRAVASRVGVTPALIAHYRPVMDEFVAEVFGEIVAAEREEVLGGFELTGDLRENLQRLIETLLDDTREDVALVWVQSWSLGARNEALGQRVRHEMDLWQSGLEDVIRRASAGTVDPEPAAWLLLAMVDGMSAHSLVKWAPHDRADLARRTLAAVLG